MTLDTLYTAYTATLRGLAAVGLAVYGSAAFAASGQSQTLGFVVTDWNTAIYESRFMDECPLGMNASNDEYWWRALPKEERARLTNDGSLATVLRQAMPNHRGPNGEDVCQQPELFNDPPLLTAQGPIAYGMNLDGTANGAATAKSCAHQKFTGVDGRPAVDNQLYRLLGCIYGWRSDGLVEVSANGARQTNGLGLILMEVTGVDDVRNDDDVTVAFYRSIDQLDVDAANNVLPHGTYRIDHASGVPRYGDVLKGRIADGVITTEGRDISLPFYGNYAFQTMDLRDARVELSMSADGTRAEGLLGAYYRLDQLWEFLGELGWQPTASYSCPAVYAAIPGLADGYPDPDTGQCTAMSSAFKFKAVAAFIRHPTAATEQAARAKGSP